MGDFSEFEEVGFFLSRPLVNNLVGEFTGKRPVSPEVVEAVSDLITSTLYDQFPGRAISSLNIDEVDFLRCKVWLAVRFSIVLDRSTVNVVLDRLLPERTKSLYKAEIILSIQRIIHQNFKSRDPLTFSKEQRSLLKKLVWQEWQAELISKKLNDYVH
jgi:hypothetical protein